MAILTRDQIEKLAEIIRKHATWVVWRLLGDKYVSQPDIDKLTKEGTLPMGVQTPMIKHSFVLGKLESLLKEAEWKELTWDQLLERATSKHTDLQKLQIEAAELSTNVTLRGLFDDIQGGLYRDLAQATGKVVTEAVVQEQVAEEIKTGVESRKGYIKVANSLVDNLKETQRNWHRVAVTEMHSAKEKGVVTSILSGEGVYRRADGQDSYVAVMPDPDACFVPEARVLTNRGNIPISEVRIGDFVVTHKLRWRKVIDFSIRSYSGRIFGENNPIATGSHPYLVNLEWSRADSIKGADQVVSLIRSSDPDNDPSVVSQEPFFDGISRSSLSGKVPISSVKLYSDLQRRNSNINVVGTNSHFRDGSESPKIFTKLFSLWSHSSFIGLSSLCLFCLCFWGKCFLSGLSGIFRKLLSLIFGHPQHAAAVGSTFGFEINIPFQKSLPKVTSRYSKVVGDGSEVLGGLSVHIDDLGLVQFRSGSRHKEILYATSRPVNNFVNDFYSGLVYNLKVEEDQSYFAEGLAVHNCEDCKRLYLDGAHPKIFRLSELLANEGTNYSRPWRQNARPVVPPLHPHCFCRLRYVPPGWGWNDKGRFTVTDPDKYSDHLKSKVDKSIDILSKAEEDHSLLGASLQHVPTREEIRATQTGEEAMKVADNLKKIKEIHSEDPEEFYRIEQLQNLAHARALTLSHAEEEASDEGQA